MPTVFISDLSGPCGQSVAAYFLKKGDKVAGLYGENLPAELSAVTCYKQDAANEAECINLAAQLKAAGGVDAVVMTAREMERTTVEGGPEELFDRVMRRNTKTAFFLCKHLGQLMHDLHGKGSLIIVGSIHGEKPNAASVAFSCSMGALKMLTRECALQMGRKGVHTVLIELGPVAGDDAPGKLDSELSPIYDGFEMSIPRKSACTFEELSALVDVAIHSPMLNGADIRADGGFMLKYTDR